MRKLAAATATTRHTLFDAFGIESILKPASECN